MDNKFYNIIIKFANVDKKEIVDKTLIHKMCIKGHFFNPSFTAIIFNQLGPLGGPANF